MGNSIQITEKPEWISWDDIHNVLWEAHSSNREKGIFMHYSTLSGNEIRQRIDGKGKMFCAIKDNKLVGTAAIVPKTTMLWYDKVPTTYAYLCFACVLPEYAGQGVYKQLYIYREEKIEKMGLRNMMFDTHENNCRILEINSKNGFVPVDYKFYKDHFNIVMVNWPGGCPYSDIRVKYEFTKRKFITKIKFILNQL